MKLSPKFKSAVKSVAATVARKTGLKTGYDWYSGGVWLHKNGIEQSRIAPLRGTGTGVACTLSLALAAYAPFSGAPENPIFGGPIISQAAHYNTAAFVLLGLYSAVLWATAAAEVHLEKTFVVELRKQAEEEEKRSRLDEERRYARIAAAADRQRQNAAAAQVLKTTTVTTTDKESEPCNLPNNPLPSQPAALPPANPPSPA